VQQRGLLSSNSEYQHFCKENNWLEGYGLFKVLKERFQQRHWKEWNVSELGLQDVKDQVRHVRSRGQCKKQALL
jgi:4-alpha-glucanotransferase